MPSIKQSIVNYTSLFLIILLLLILLPYLLVYLTLEPNILFNLTLRDKAEESYNKYYTLTLSRRINSRAKRGDSLCIYRQILYNKA